MIAALAIAAIGAVLSLAIYALTAERRAGRELARADVLTEQLAVARANTETEKRRADAEKERGDALDAAIARAAARAVGPVHGAFAELLQEAADARSRATDHRDPAVVPDAGAAGGPAAAHRGDAGDLLKPGE